MRAVLRRVPSRPSRSAPRTSRSGRCGSSSARARAFLDGAELALSRKEFDLLAELVSHAGEVVTREDLISRVWDENWFGSTKTLDVHVGWLRGKLGDDAVRAAAAAHRARRRLPLHGARGMGVLTLRARLVLALAYVLVLAIGSMLVPLVRSVRDRVAAEVKQQALEPGGGRRRDRGRRRAELDALVATSAREVRGRVVIVDRDGDRARRQLAGRRSARTTRRAPRSRRALRGDIDAGPARQRDARAARSWPPRSRSSATAERDGAVRITQSVDAVSRARVVGDGRAGARRPDRARARAGRGRAPGRQRRAAAAAAGGRGPAGRRGRPVRARAGRGLARAARGRRGVQRDDRARAADGRRAARLRRRRVAPAADAADRAAAAARGGRGDRRRARPPSRSRARWRRSTGCPASSPSCSS